MKIACLAWGSLIWKSAPLELASSWKDDGPQLPIELVRVGDGGELATTLWAGAATQRSLWALLKQTDLSLARELLRQREKIDADRPEWVGSYPTQSAYPWNSVIAQWLRTKDLDAVIWTALPPRFEGVEGQAPDMDQAVRYLQQLQGDRRRHAESYIRRIPPDLSTRYRRAIETALGWLPSAA